MGQGLSDVRREALRALCDTIVPRIERDDDPGGFWVRTATELGVDAAAEDFLLGIPDPVARDGLLELLDGFAESGIESARDQAAREAIVAGVADSSPEAAYGVGSLIALILYIHYGAADPSTGVNPNWATFGYPGPQGPPPEVSKLLEVIVPEGDELALDADACVIGSGAGGGVVAATLAAAGLDVVILEAAGYFNESDFAQLELKAHQEMYWRGGPTPTADGNVSLQAGTTLGGGTTINWTNCLRTRPSVREQWAREHGLEDIGGPEFDRHLDAVLERLGATDACSDPNGPQQRMREGCERLGWSTETIVRNADPGRYEPESAGYMGFGDRSGAKLSGEKTFLADAQAAAARIVAKCRAQRVLAESGRASGVEATYLGSDGEAVPVRVRSPRVIVACGSLESPALLLRSEIGGPAVGSRLHVHPCTAVFASYPDDQRAWWGPPQALLCDQFADTGDAYGFLVETAQYAPGITGSAVPWTTGEDHKEMMSRVRYGASFIALTRDRGHGRVEIDANGEAAPFYEIADELDLDNLRKGLDAQIRIHEAAGAEEIYALAAGLPGWRRGENDLETFVAAAQAVPFRVGGHRLFSAHQMGSCPMGTDPQTSVANRWGELHDTRGVWIGDASAFPTSSGTNPMVTIMALARRTAEAIISAG
jgi:choline dehydrogenase-like flavoprotein